jgi:hypothetical protein
MGLAGSDEGHVQNDIQWRNRDRVRA